MELIDKQKAKQALVDLPTELDAITVQKAIEAIGFVKAEDISPVMRGHLKNICIDEAYCEMGDCSVCGSWNPLPANYCRSCGAKMDVENSVDNVEKG